MSAALPLTTLPPALADLADLPRWVGWKWEERDGKRTKVPKTVGNRNASTSLPIGWVTHLQASLWTQCDGVGFVLTNVKAADLVAIDLDGVRDPQTGNLLPWAQSLVERCGTYTEVTPSGTGLRIIGFAPEVEGAVDRKVKHKGGGSFELYACPKGRFITVTGQKLPAAPECRADISRPFLELLAMAPTATPDRPPLPWETANDGDEIDFDSLDVLTQTMLTTVPEGANRSENFNGVVKDLKRAGHGIPAIVRLFSQYPNGPARKYAGRLLQEVTRSWHKAEDPLPVVEVVAEELPPHDPATGEIVEAAPTGELPEALTHPPGLLGELVDWIVATSRRPNRVLALGAAITTLGTIIGRRTAGPTASGTHLYVVALAPSGAGKDHPLRQADALLKAANASHLIGPDEFISMPAFVNFMSRQPLSLVPMDEIGAWFKRIGDQRASPYEKALTKVMRSAWGASFKSLRTPEWAGKESIEIQSPSMSIFGVSTPDEFFEALQGGDVINGFLNRFLLLTSEARARDRDPELDPLKVPEEMAARLARLHIETQRLTPRELRSPIESDLDRRDVEWSRDGKAKARFRLLSSDMESLCDDPERAPYFARTAEMAVRLATIVAVGDDPAQPTVKSEHMRWGADLALWSAQRMQKLAKGYIAENETQRLFNHILRIIERRGWAITHRNLQVALHGKVKSRELADTMKTLQEAGYVEAVRTVPPGGGPPTILYRRPHERA